MNFKYIQTKPNLASDKIRVRLIWRPSRRHINRDRTHKRKRELLARRKNIDYKRAKVVKKIKSEL